MSPIEPRRPAGGESPEELAEMEHCLLAYVRSYSRFYSRADSKTLQRSREQLFQERELAPLVERLERLHGPLHGSRVLEIGSGSGGRSVAVAMAGAHVCGVEPSEAGVVASRLRAKRYPDLAANFRVGVGEQLPFPDASFDLVFSTEVLQHVQDLPRVIAETRRVLKRGGHCYHEAPNNLYPWEFHYRVFWIPYLPKPLGKAYARLMGKDPRHLDDITFLYRPSVAALLRRNGFGEIRDMYSEELARKALGISSIRSPAKRRAYGLLRRVGAANLAVRLASTLGVHPQLRIWATLL